MRELVTEPNREGAFIIDSIVLGLVVVAPNYTSDSYYLGKYPVRTNPLFNARVLLSAFSVADHPIGEFT